MIILDIGETHRHSVLCDKDQSANKFVKYVYGQIKDRVPETCDSINNLIIKYKNKTPISLNCLCDDNKHGNEIAKIISKAKYCINWFSNMPTLDEPIVYDGVDYFSVENFYQAMKTKDRETRIKIAAMSPFESKSFARNIEIREDWEDVKIEVMRYGLTHKFSNNYKWKYRLIDYGKPIIEWNNWKDTFWGKCIFTKDGENNLGKLLTELREKLLTEENI